MEQYKVVIDYPNRELTIIPPDASPDFQAACSGVEVSLVEGQDWGLASKIDTDIGELVLVWDTGTAASGVLKSRTDFSEFEFKDGDTLSVERFEIDSHGFGPETLEVWDWTENSPPFDEFIGYDFFA